MSTQRSGALTARSPGSTSAARGVTVESFDLNALRVLGGEAERQAMAERIYAVWLPLFDHLREADARVTRAAHVDDDSAAWKRVWFYRREGRDLGAIIGRVHDHTLDGRPFSRITMNAGLDPSLIGANVGGAALALTLLAALARAPLRPLFLIDTMSSAPALAAMRKAFPALRPSPDGDVDDALWAYAACAAPSLRCAPVPGRLRGVVQAACVVAERATGEPTQRSAAALRAEAWFHQHVRRGESLLVVCPIGPRYAARRVAWWLWRRLIARLGGTRV